MRSETVTTVVDADRETVFSYLANIENLPKWATEFARELKCEGGDYKVVNGLGEFFFAIHADPDTGVVDMYAGPDKERMAVFPRGGGLEAIDDRRRDARQIHHPARPVEGDAIQEHQHSVRRRTADDDLLRVVAARGRRTRSRCSRGRAWPTNSSRASTSRSGASSPTSMRRSPRGENQRI